MMGAEETGEPSSSRVKGDPTYNTIALLLVLHYNTIAVSHPPVLLELHYSTWYKICIQSCRPDFLELTARQI